MDKYVRIKQIGEGSFGKALLMKRKDDGKMCVIKEIGISKMSKKEQNDSKKEVKVLSQLKHQNIVSYLESFEGRGNLYIVMDYCDGGDVYQYIRNQKGVPIEENKVLDIFIQCCLAIKYVHDRKILHRDIKTQNIFLTKDKIVKLGDFGIARVLKSTVELAHTCIGTPYYLSPEIVENRPYNNKSDIWSLGCVLYELVTLKHAFEAGNMRNLVMKIVRGSYPPISNKYSFEIRALVSETFKRSPTSRPSINTILKKPIIQKRIERFVPQEKKVEDIQEVHEASEKPIPKSSAVEPVKKPYAMKRRDDIANIYGASLAKKPNRKSPPSAANAAAAVKPKKKIISANKKSPLESTKEVAARDRRRKNLVEAEKLYVDQMKKVQQERWQRQNLDQMKMARGAGWRHILGNTNEVDKKDKEQLKKVKESKKEEKPSLANQDWSNIKDPPEQKPSNHKVPIGHPQRSQINVLGENKESERAKLLDDYWQRKKEAGANKMRANQDLYGRVKRKSPTPNNIDGNVVRPPPVQPQGRNRQEQEYLRQLEAIRYQNFIERKAIKKKESLKIDVKNDPKFDPEARKKKIEELKKQGEERGAYLLQKNKPIQKPIVKRPEVWCHKKEDVMKNDERPLPVLMKKVQKDEIVKPPVGIDTAMGQVQMPKMMRSLSEGDLQEAVQNVPRKNWGPYNVNANSFAFVNLPMEMTGSAMEATMETSTNENKNKESKIGQSDKRRNWAHEGNTQLVANLYDKQINMTIAPTIHYTQNQNQDLPDDESKRTAILSNQKVTDELTQSDRDDLNKSSIGSSTMTLNPAPNKTICIEKESNSDEAVRAEAASLPVIGHDGDNALASPSTNTFVISPRKPNKELTKIHNENLVPVSYETNSKTIKISDENIVKNESSFMTYKVNKTENTPIESCQKKDILAVSESSDPTVTSPSIQTDSNISFVDLEKNTVNVSSNSESVLTENLSPKTPEDLQSKNVSNILENKPITSGDVEVCLEELKFISLETSKSIKNAPVQAWTENIDAKEEEKEEMSQSSIDDEDDKEEEELHTPNRTLGLRTGVYDTATKLLRTCSLPELNNFPCISPLSSDDSSAANNDDSISQEGNDKESSHDKNETELVVEEYKEDEDEDEGRDEDEDDIEDDEEEDDYASMLESMCDLLSNTNGDDVTNDGNETNEEDSVEWESDDEECLQTAKAKELKMKEDQFSRNEESRQLLEDELGFDMFIQVYKNLQALQDDESDELELEADDITRLLGDKPHLYQKILYLVMADSAYCEGNDGME